MSRVIIIGAGLAGSLLSIYLAKRGYQVYVYEARGDMRRESVTAGRSINLALSDRGIAALSEVGMDEYMLSEAVPMLGRMIHTREGTTRFLPYSGRDGEYINSVSRSGLNIALINEAEKYQNVHFYFNEQCVDFDCSSGSATFSSGTVVSGDTLIATDGAGSAVRHAMMNGGLQRFDFSQKWLDHGYKELHIPPVPIDGQPHDRDLVSGDGRFAIDKNALHIWPRNKFMMIALPNFDGSFTATLFLAHESKSTRAVPGDNLSLRDTSQFRLTERGFDEIRTEEEILRFFDAEFPDAVPLMPTLVEDYLTNPVGNLGTIKCFPWNAEGRALLLGDSAHALVPFYGQGMNCAFEDVRVLDQLIGTQSADWETIYRSYSKLRKPNTDAIADMAEENFYEMRDATGDPVFLRKRELETKLEQTYPDYFSKYSMVTFREDLPYSVAKSKGNLQDILLMRICADIENVEDVVLDDVAAQIKAVFESY